MEKFSLICDLIVAICGVLPTIVSVVLLVKNIIENKNWKVIEKIVLSAMSSIEEYAKEHPDLSSDGKLDMALDAIKSGLTAAGISFDANLIKKIIEYINTMCSWSKTVNTNVEKKEN